MTSTNPPSREHHHPHGERPPEGCPECSFEGLDNLKWVAEGIKAQTAYISSTHAELDARRARIDGAAYSEARASASDDVRDIRDQLTRIRDQLARELPADVLQCLGDSWEEVRKRLEYCGVPSDRCIDDDCEFDEGCEDVSTDDLKNRQAEYEHRVEAAEECFDQLINEPAELQKRVAKLKADVEALAKNTSDTELSCAMSLWYWRRLEDIWLGFEDADEYHDHLHEALLCSVKGHRVISVLVGEIAVRTRRELEEKGRCDQLKTHVVDEILASYQKRTLRALRRG